MLLRRGAFENHRISDSRSMLNEGYRRTDSFDPSAIHSCSGTAVFISHKHSDLNDLKELEGFLGLLKTKYNVYPYLDCLDDGMPTETCAETAARIKQVIDFCPRFILLATEAALASRWCNWEVGIADKWKLSHNAMAILPILDRGADEKKYKGNEYLQLYPYIEKEPTTPGYYRLVVKFPKSNGGGQRLLGEWLNNRIDG